MSTIIQRDKNGFFWKVYFRFISLPRHLLRYYFKFYPFNLIPTQAKKYCVELIIYLNSKKNKESVAEIGCGLGDILRNINYKKKFGYDKQIEVLNALNFINKFYRKDNRIQLSQLILGEDSIDEGQHDVIILVNWIHKVPTNVLQKSLKELFNKNLKIGGEIIIDSLSGDKKIYPYHHDLNLISKKLSSQMKLIGTYSMGKNFNIIRKIASFKKLN